MSYVYRKVEKELWTVGFYDSRGGWVSESDHSDKEQAAQRVHFLHGGMDHRATLRLIAALERRV